MAVKKLALIAGIVLFALALTGRTGAYQGIGPWVQISSGTPVVTTALQATAQTVTLLPATLAPGQCTNAETTNWAYVQIFDATAPTVGTTVAKQSYGIPPAGGSIVPTSPLNFNVAIRVAATTTSTGSTNAVTGLTCNWSYR